MKFKKLEKGFSMVEMLVVFFIFAVLIAMVFTSHNQNQEKTILDSAAYKLVADIRKQQTAAGLEDITCSGLAGYKYSYGFYANSSLNSSGYELFSDCDATDSKSAPDKITLVNLPKEVELGNTNGAINIAFYPPGPSVLINNDLNQTSATITIYLKSNNLVKKTITINKVGLIDIE